MTDFMEWTLAGDPVPEGRPRASIVSGHAHVNADPKSKDWRRFAAQVFATDWSGPPIESVVWLSVNAVCKRPKALMRKGDPDGRVWCGKKPDADNIAKSVMDALVEGGVLRDDGLVAKLDVHTLYASKSEGPSVWLSIQDPDELPL